MGNLSPSSFFSVGNKTLFCCLFFMGFATASPLKLTTAVGDVFVGQASAKGTLPTDSSGLTTFFDSTGYFAASIIKEGDTLVVHTGIRWRLDTLFVTLDAATDTVVVHAPYSASFLHRQLVQRVTDLASQGYPYASLAPQLIKMEGHISVVVVGSKGPFVAHTEVEVISERKVKPWLVKRSLLFEPEQPYNLSALKTSEEKLRRQSYIKSATFGSPEMRGSGDTVSAVIPLYYQGSRQLLFDGVIAYQSNQTYPVTGRGTLATENVVGYGEQLAITYAGEGEWQRAELTFNLPYMGGSPLSLGLFGRIEVDDEDGGFGKVALRLGLDVWQSWQVGFGLEYHEASQAELRKQYGGIVADLQRFHAPLEKKVLDWQALLLASSGLTGEGSHTLARASMDANLLLHLPFGSFAYVGELRGAVMAFADKDSIFSQEKWRLGGYATVRGYQEELYPAIGFALNRSAFRFYLNQQGALYLFMDNAVKVQERYAWADAYWMMGYGLGISLPVKAIRVQVEWARQRMEKSGLGRIHFSLSNR